MKSRRLLIEFTIALSTIFILLWIFLPKFLAVQTINMPQYIPDPAIRRAASIALLHQVDAPFTKKQANEYTGTLKIDRCTNLKGLEYFPNLTELQIHSYFLKEMDFAMLPKLEVLHITGGDIITIITTGNPELTDLKVHFQSTNRLVNLPLQLDLSNNAKLEHLSLYDCQKLDVTHCPNLKTLFCMNFYGGRGMMRKKIGLAAIDLSNNPELEEVNLADNLLRTLDLSHNPKLTTLSCDRNELEELDLRGNPLLHAVAAKQPTLKTIHLPDEPKFKEIWVEFDLLDERTRNELEEKNVKEYKESYGFGITK